MDALTNASVNIGQRVKYAREQLRLNQQDVSAALGFNDRQTLSDIENRKWGLKAGELLKLSDALDQDVEFFIDPFGVVGEAQYSWPASTNLPEDELDQFEATASSWVGLLRWLRSQECSERSPLGFTLRLAVNSSVQAAQYAAEQLVCKHQLGLVPALTLPQFIEKELDIPVLFVDAGPPFQQSSISGVACHLPEMCVILLNCREGAARRNFYMAVELFHALTWARMKSENGKSSAIGSQRRNRQAETLAENFAAALLMPRTSLDALMGDGRSTDVVKLFDVAKQLQVSAEALGWRLHSLGRIDEATRVALSQFHQADSAEALPGLFSRSFVEQLHVALDKGRLSARKAAKTLGFSLHELTQLFEAYRMPTPFFF